MKKFTTYLFCYQFLVGSCFSQNVIKNEITFRGLCLEIADISVSCDRCRGTKYITTDSSANYEFDFRTRIVLTDKKTLIMLASFFYQKDNRKRVLAEDASINAYEIKIKEDNKILLHYLFSSSLDSRNFFYSVIAFLKKNKLDVNLIEVLETTLYGTKWL
jgi:hypothetical protein